MSNHRSKATRSRELSIAVTNGQHDYSPAASGIPPGIHDGRGLEETINELMTRVRDATPFSTGLQFDGWEPLEDRDRIDLVYTIVREAVQHAVAHSGGTHIVVSLARRGRQCEICIWDDGKTKEFGSRTETSRGTMDQSARALGGSIDTAHRLTGGTAVRLRFQV